jgi:putative colanic acid biosynthesis acetyltransferase WcaF
VLRIFGARIGKSCAINASAKIWAPWNLKIGNYVAIGAYASCYNVDKIIMIDKVVVSQNASLCTASHDISSESNRLVHEPIVLESFSWVAAEAFVGMGVTIHQGAVVGARAAVFKDVDAWTVVGGNPAKFIKERIIKDE